MAVECHQSQETLPLLFGTEQGKKGLQNCKSFGKVWFPSSSNSSFVVQQYVDGATRKFPTRKKNWWSTAERFKRSCVLRDGKGRFYESKLKNDGTHYWRVYFPGVFLFLRGCKKFQTKVLFIWWLPRRLRLFETKRFPWLFLMFQVNWGWRLNSCNWRMSAQHERFSALFVTSLCF